MRCPHTSFRQGKRLRIVLRSGEIFEDHFVERKGRFLILRERGRISFSDLRSAGVARGNVVKN